VYVGIPVDVLAATIPDTGRALPVPRIPEVEPPATRDVDAALALIARSRRPLIWAGGGAVASGAADAVAALAWRLGAPVVTTYAARGLLPAGHPMLVDAPPHEPEVAELLGSADLLLALGTGFDAMTTRNWTQPVPDHVLAVNLDPAHLDPARLDPAYEPEVGLVADVRLTCDSLAVRLRQREPWADSVFRIGPAIRARLAADPRTREAVDLLSSVEAAWPDDGPVLCDMAVAGYWVGGYAARRAPRTLQYPVGWGTLGYALPAAIGAAYAGACPVLAVCGDGGAAMAVGELATLVQQRLPVTVLLVDDGGYGMLRFDQQVFGHPERGVDLAGPDWLALAAAYGVDAEEATGAGEPLRAALARAAASGRPRLVLLRAALFPPRTTSPRWAEP
jgi:acetolactate synthase-1/2/3 large subunit